MRKDYIKISSVILLLFTLTALIILSLYNQPMGDDFYFGHIAREMSTVDAVRFWYNNWGGRYSQSLFLTIFNPLSYNDMTYFWVPPMIIIIVLSLVVFFVLRLTSKNTLSNSELLLFFSVIIFLFFNLMPEIGETIYWISGSYTFQLGNVAFLILLYVILSLENGSREFKKIVLSLAGILLIFLISGFNEVSMIYTLGLLMCYLILKIALTKKAPVYLLFFCLASILGAYISVSAPGNLIRASATGGLFQGITKGLLESIGRGTFYLAQWIPSSLLVTPFIWESIGKIHNNYADDLHKRRVPFWVAVAFIVLIVFIGFLPSLLSTGWNPPRAVSPVFLVYTIAYYVLIINYYDFLDHYVRIFLVKNSRFRVGLLFIVVLALSSNNNILNVYKDLTSFKANKYKQEVTSAYRQMGSQSGDTVFVYPLKYRPLALPIRWPDHYNKLVNNEWQMYFGKNVEMAEDN